MAEQEGKIVNGLKLGPETASDLGAVMQNKGVNVTRVFNNSVRTERFLIDLVDDGKEVVVVEPGAIRVGGFILAKVIGYIDPNINYQSRQVTDRDDLPPNVIPFRLRR